MFIQGGDMYEQVSVNRNDDEVAAEKLKTRRGGYELAAADTPTIGMMNGLAYGGGAVASSLDIRIGCEHSKFRQQQPCGCTPLGRF